MEVALHHWLSCQPVEPRPVRQKQSNCCHFCTLRERTTWAALSLAAALLPLRRNS
jgi:hypothetical protein